MNLPRRSLAALAIALSALALTACLERKQTGMINPDGSGKLTVDTLMEAPPAPPPAPGAPKPDMTEIAKQLATGFIAQSQGIDAWKDIVVETAKDGRPHVTATAYFSDISKVKLDAVMPLAWTRDAKGNATLSIVQESPPAPASQPSLTDEQVAAEVAKQQAEYKQNLPMAQSILGTLRLETSYQLPGTVAETNIFSKSSDNSVTLVVEGKKLLAAMDKIMADDKRMAAAIKSGKNISDDQDLVIETMFGVKGPIKVSVTGADKPLFDYKTEMEAAKATQADAFKKAGIDPTKPPSFPGGMMPPPAQEAPAPEPATAPK